MNQRTVRLRGWIAFKANSILEEAYMVNMLEQGLSLHSQCYDVPSVSTVVHNREANVTKEGMKGVKQ